jgi:dihydropyrimidinase
MLDLVIRGGTVVTSNSTVSADVGVVGETIAAVGPNLSGRREIDATGLLVFPGLVDAHTHMALPVAGTRSSDDFLSGTRAAACGGVTTIVDFTVGSADRTMVEALDDRLQEARDAVVDYALHGEVVGWRPGREKEFHDAAARGVTSFKFYTTYSASGRRTTPAGLRASFREISLLDAVAVVHAEDDGLIRSIAARLTADERGAMRTLAKARPDLAEQVAISTVTRIAHEAVCRVHIVHVSSRIGLDAVRAARAGGCAVTAETCPQYLVLTRDVYDRDDGRLFSASPPLRGDEDRAALWSGMRSHDVDLIATDHCPFTRAQKAWRGTFDDLPYGLPGVETLLPLLYTDGVATGRLAVHDVARLACEAPARLYGLYPKKGAIEVGADADLVLFDPAELWRLEARALHSNCDFSPYEGRPMTGRVVETLSRGEAVFADGEACAAVGRGRYVARGSAAGTRVAR